MNENHLFGLDNGIHNLKEMQVAIITGLPVHARWMVNGTPLDYDFSDAHQGLHEPFDCIECSDKERTELLIFGKYDYAEGGGAAPWLCIRKIDGAVVGLDLERENSIFLLNSSLERFIQTFRFLNEYLGTRLHLPSDVATRMREIDADAYPSSDWNSLVDCITAGM